MAEASDAGVVRELLLPLSRFLKDTSLYEIVVNHPAEVLTEGVEGSRHSALADLSFGKLMRLARAIVSYSNQAINEARPLLSVFLPDEDRIEFVVPPATSEGTVSVTIRKPSSVTLTLDDLEAGGLFSHVSSPNRSVESSNTKLDKILKASNYATFLRAAVLALKNIIISGATESGKTALSKALIRDIPEHERIISIEDTPELVISQLNHVRLFYSKGGQKLAKISAKDLLESCLRMRPIAFFYRSCATVRPSITFAMSIQGIPDRSQRCTTIPRR